MKPHKLSHCYPWQAAALHFHGKTVTALCGAKLDPKRPIRRNPRAKKCPKCVLRAEGK